MAKGKHSRKNGGFLRPHDKAERQFNEEFPQDEPFPVPEAKRAAEDELLEKFLLEEQKSPTEEEETPAPPVKRAPKGKKPFDARTPVIVALLCVIAFSAWKLGGMIVQYRKLDKGFSDLADEMVSTPAPTAEPTPRPVDEETGEEEPEAPAERPPIVVNMEALLSRNPDTVGWLYCEDTPIDFAIVQSYNNATYMGWDFDRQYSDYGWPFMDYRCRGDFTGWCSTIYGHNMQNGSVFAVLEKFQKQEFADEHRLLWMFTPNGTLKLRPMAGVFLYGIEEAYGGFGDNEANFRAFLLDVKAASVFQTDMEPSDVERVVMLSTCSNVKPEMRFAVICAAEWLEE